MPGDAAFWSQVSTLVADQCVDHRVLDLALDMADSPAREAAFGSTDAADQVKGVADFIDAAQRDMVVNFAINTGFDAHSDAVASKMMRSTHSSASSHVRPTSVHVTPMRVLESYGFVFSEVRRVLQNVCVVRIDGQHSRSETHAARAAAEQHRQCLR